MWDHFGATVLPLRPPQRPAAVAARGVPSEKHTMLQEAAPTHKIRGRPPQGPRQGAGRDGAGAHHRADALSPPRHGAPHAEAGPRCWPGPRGCGSSTPAQPRSLASAASVAAPANPMQPPMQRSSEAPCVPGTMGAHYYFGPRPPPCRRCLGPDRTVLAPGPHPAARTPCDPAPLGCDQTWALDSSFWAMSAPSSLARCASSADCCTSS